MEALASLLPFALFLLICPLMMLFMHRGGHGAGHHDHSGDRPATQPNASKDEVRL